VWWRRLPRGPAGGVASVACGHRGRRALLWTSRSACGRGASRAPVRRWRRGDGGDGWLAAGPTPTIGGRGGGVAAGAWRARGGRPPAKPCKQSLQARACGRSRSSACCCIGVGVHAGVPAGALPAMGGGADVCGRLRGAVARPRRHGLRARTRGGAALVSFFVLDAPAGAAGWRRELAETTASAVGRARPTRRARAGPCGPLGNQEEPRPVCGRGSLWLARLCHKATVGGGGRPPNVEGLPLARVTPARASASATDALLPDPVTAARGLGGAPSARAALVVCPKSAVARPRRLVGRADAGVCPLAALHIDVARRGAAAVSYVPRDGGPASSTGPRGRGRAPAGRRRTARRWRSCAARGPRLLTTGERPRGGGRGLRDRPGSLSAIFR